MSISSEITRINTNIANAYTACNNKGATMPLTQNSANLATTIGTISGGGGRSWSQIGYSAEPSFIGTGFTYAKNIYDNWSPTTSYASKFENDVNLIFMPLVNTSTGTTFESMFSGCSSLMTVPTLVTSSGTKFNKMFNNCSSLKEVGSLDTSNGTNFASMFNGCSGLITLPNFNTSNGTDFSLMFQNCTNLATVPSLDLSKGTSFSTMFSNCKAFTTVPNINTSLGTTFSSMFNNNPSLVTVPELDTSSATSIGAYVFGSCRALTNFGGFKNAGQAYLTSRAANYNSYTIQVSDSTNLTEQSLINILTKLYDIATKGCNAQKCTLGATNLAKLTSSAGQAALTQAQNRGWTVS